MNSLALHYCVPCVLIASEGWCKCAREVRAGRWRVLRVSLLAPRLQHAPALERASVTQRHRQRPGHAHLVRTMALTLTLFTSYLWFASLSFLLEEIHGTRGRHHGTIIVTVWICKSIAYSQFLQTRANGPKLTSGLCSCIFLAINITISIFFIYINSYSSTGNPK